MRACSLLEEIVVGPATEVYRRFRRLGVYQWADVLALAKGDEQSQVMALRFANTELFVRPVSWSRLASHGVRSSLQGPERIDAAQFAEMYRAGFNL